VSFNDGASWTSLQLPPKKGGLPIVPVTDLAVRDGILIAATQGRGIWALDDLTVLRQQEAAGAKVRLLQPAPAWRFGLSARGGQGSGVGTNPPGGVVVHYELSGVKEGTKLKLEFLDAQGGSLRSFDGEVRTPAPAPDEVEAVAMGDGPPAATLANEDPPRDKADKKDKDKKDVGKKKDEPKVPGAPGMNRFAWNLRTEPAEGFEGLVLWAGERFEGPAVVPGEYEARLTVGDAKRSQRFRVLADPRSSATADDLKAQFDFLGGVRDKLTAMHKAIERIRKVRTDLGGLAERAGTEDKTKALRDAIEAAKKKMTEVEEALYQTKNKSQQDPLNFPIRLNDKLALLGRSVATGSFAPTAQAIAVRNELVPKIDAELDKWKAVVETDLPAIERLAKEAELPMLATATPTAAPSS
jgi:hypothetical protein